MSGGTDSSVAAMLLLRRGYDVQGITFRFFEGENSTNEYLADAASVCSKLHIKHHVYDARDIFREKIIDYFVQEYLSGRTPFPCAKCNNELKWKLIFEEAARLVEWYELSADADLDTTKEITITFWHRMGAASQALVQKWIGEFEEIYPNITVIEEKAAGDYTALSDKIALAIPAGNQPDIAESYPDHIARYAAAKAPLALNNFINNPNIGFTEEEIKILIEQGRDIGLIAEAEREMVSGIFRLGDRRVEALMTPRPVIATRRRLLMSLRVLLDILDGVADGLDLLGVLIGDIQVELLFELHHQLYGVQRVGP